MKKHLLKLTLLAFVVLFGASTIQAQEFEEYTKVGVYTINIPGEDLLMTIDPATSNVIWAAKLSGPAAATQEWTIQDHVTPASSGLMQITAEVPGAGMFTLTTSTTDEMSTTLDLSVRPGAPMQVEPNDYSGKDQIQRRKTPTSRGGNDALFLRVPWGNTARFGTAPTAAGEVVQFRFGGAIDKLEFKFVRDLPPASVNTFGVDAFSISNPISNELVIKGATSRVNQISLYSILGGKVLTKIINTQNDINLDVSSLASGLYIVEVTGDNARFTQKLIKQ